MHSWHEIEGANEVHFSPGPMIETTYYRRIVNGDFCSLTDSNILITVSDAPEISPSVNCSGSTV